VDAIRNFLIVMSDLLLNIEQVHYLTKVSHLELQHLQLSFYYKMIWVAMGKLYQKFKMISLRSNIS